jgi:hypothetical protein
MGAVGHGIDPTLDAAGVTGPECFLCAKRRNHGHECDATFGGVTPASFDMLGRDVARSIDTLPQLALHKECLEGRDPQAVAFEYHVRIVDAVNLPRFVARKMYGPTPAPKPGLWD